MFTDNVLEATPMTSTLRRRGVGKAIWRRVIDNLIASEKEDMIDLAVLRRKITDPELLRIIAAMQERKTIRVIELNELLRYKESRGDEQ